MKECSESDISIFCRLGVCICVSVLAFCKIALSVWAGCHSAAAKLNGTPGYKRGLLRIHLMTWLGQALRAWSQAVVTVRKYGSDILSMVAAFPYAVKDVGRWVIIVIVLVHYVWYLSVALVLGRRIGEVLLFFFSDRHWLLFAYFTYFCVWWSLWVQSGSLLMPQWVLMAWTLTQLQRWLDRDLFVRLHHWRDRVLKERNIFADWECVSVLVSCQM